MKSIWIMFLFISVGSFGQEFKTLSLLPDSNLSRTVAGKRITYAYNTYVFDCMGRVLKVRENKKLVLTDEGMEDQKSSIPHLLLAKDSSDHPVLIADVISESLIGFNLYLIKGAKSVKIGFFPIATFVPGTGTDVDVLKAVSPADKLVVETDGTQLRIYFATDQLIFHPGTGDEEVVKGEPVKFLFNGKKLKEVEEF